MRFEVDGSGEIRVIIKFVDEERAAAFIEKVIDSSESAANSLFKMIRFASLEFEGLSPLIFHPILFIYTLL